MDTTKSRFFIALLPPQEIQDYTNGIKQLFAERYDSRGAQKSPPHITLQPPFEWVVENVAVLEEFLRQFASKRSAVPITLSGFGSFAPRMIFIDVVKTPQLLALQAELMAEIEEALGIVDEVGKKRSFAPHMTVAFKDLTRQNFKAAWLEFENQALHFEFIATQLTLLIHDGKRWNIHSEFAFRSISAVNAHSS